MEFYCGLVGNKPLLAGAGGALDDESVVRVFVQARTDFSLSIREGIPVLVPTDKDDPLQSWIKVDKFGEWMKDEAGHPGFSLVNKVTGLALKHPVGKHRPVQLGPYSPFYMDEAVLWTSGGEDGAGYQAIRMINDIDLNLDALLGNSRRVDGGFLVSVWGWNAGGNQKWNIATMN